MHITGSRNAALRNVHDLMSRYQIKGKLDLRADTGMKPFKIVGIHVQALRKKGDLVIFEAIAECEYESGCIAPWSLHRIRFFANGKPAFNRMMRVGGADSGFVCWNSFPGEGKGEKSMHKGCECGCENVCECTCDDEDYEVTGKTNGKKQEDNMSVRSLYKVKNEETYCRKVGKNREGKVVVEIVGGDRNAQLMAVDSDMLEEVVPYTIKVKNFSSVNSNEYFIQVKEGSIQLHDLLVVSCDAVPKFVEVIELDSKSRQYHEPKKVSKIVLQEV